MSITASGLNVLPKVCVSFAGADYKCALIACILCVCVDEICLESVEWANVELS